MLLAGVNLLPGFTVIGIVNGGTFALLAIGIVLIYRVSGVLNFAHGAVAMFSTFCAYQVSERWHQPAWIGLLAAVAAGMALGYVIERFTIRPLADRTALVRTTVTIGWLLVLQELAGIIWGKNSYHQAVKVVPLNRLFTAPGGAPVATDQFLMVAVAIGLAAVVAGVLRQTSFGAQMRAVADDPDAARLWGIDVNRVTAASWVVGSAMAAVAGVLLTPRLNFDQISLTVLVIEGLVAAVIGGLSSLPLAVAGAFALGVAEEWPRAFVTTNPGIEKFVAVVAVVLVLVVRPPRSLADGAA
ncbi:MAG: branched-chain amino acid ABC transporter permease [Acidimicrobiales bacterium]